MAERVLVTGGAGRLGQWVVRGLLARGAAVRVLGRRERPADVPAGAEYARADLVSGAGLDAALEGVSRVVHLASSPRQPNEDIQAAGHLWAAARRAEVVHLLYISIVGIDDMQAYPYYAAKLAVERSLKASGLPFSILRATQFHDFVRSLLRMGERGPLLLLPAGVRLQPVETAAVAERTVDAVLGAPARQLPDLAGPEVRSLASLGRAYLRATGQRRVVLPLPLALPAARVWQRGRATSRAAQRIGRSWEDWLAQPGEEAR